MEWGQLVGLLELLFTCPSFHFHFMSERQSGHPSASFSVGFGHPSLFPSPFYFLRRCRCRARRRGSANSVGRKAHGRPGAMCEREERVGREEGGGVGGGEWGGGHNSNVPHCITSLCTIKFMA